jgi:hypothetical protein
MKFEPIRKTNLKYFFHLNHRLLKCMKKKIDCEHFSDYFKWFQVTWAFQKALCLQGWMSISYTRRVKENKEYYQTCFKTGPTDYDLVKLIAGLILYLIQFQNILKIDKLMVKTFYIKLYKYQHWFTCFNVIKSL